MEPRRRVVLATSITVMNSLLPNSDPLGSLDNVYSDSGERGTKVRDD